MDGPFCFIAVSRRQEVKAGSRPYPFVLSLSKDESAIGYVLRQAQDERMEMEGRLLSPTPQHTAAIDTYYRTALSPLA